MVRGNWVHDNAAPGISVTSGCVVDHNLVTNHTGASSDGITCNLGSSTAQGLQITNNTVYASARDGIRAGCTAGAGATGTVIKNNILDTNTGCGVNMGGTGAAGAGWPALSWYDGNWYHGNGTARCNMDDVGSVNPINASSPYTNVLDVTGTADPFTAKASNNYSLNTTAGGGASARASGTPGAIPGVSQVGYPDMGVFQSQSSTGGANSATAQ